tara:strand:+ start:691 stop:1230 length:540 start_codon:yes stop_codon:yes gene_type:complete
MKFRFYILVIPLILTIISCKKEINQTSDIKLKYFQSIDEWNELELIQTNSKFGEWGGDTFVIRVYKDFNNGLLLGDYKELDGSKIPPPPPKTRADSLHWYNYKSVLFEKKRLVLSENEKELIEKSIIELVKSRISNSNIFSHSGISNQVIYKDSTLIIYDYPSIEWSNFQKLKKIFKGN